MCVHMCLGKSENIAAAYEFLSCSCIVLLRVCVCLCACVYVFGAM